MRTNLPKIPLTTGVGLGFLFLLILMAVFIVVGVTQMSAVNNRVNHLVNHDNVKVALVHKMKDGLRERAVAMHNMSLMTDPFEQEDEYLRLGNLGARFVDARNRFMAMRLSKEEQEILKDIRDVTIKTQPMLVDAVAAAMDGKNEKARKIIRETAAPAQFKLNEMLDNLIQIQIRNAQVTVKTTDKAYERAWWLMFFLGSGAVLLGIGITIFVVRHTKKQAKLLQYQAMYDSLTGLPNRSLFTDRLQQTVLVGQRERQSFALIALDLDRFKEVNDTLGHHIGDEVLCQTARIVRGALRESDTLARMGGDEFSILLQTAQTREGAERVAERILDALRNPVDILGHEFEIGASLGIAMFPEHAKQPDELQRNADAAMYQAKRNHSGFATFTKELEKTSEDQFTLRSEIRKAIANEEFILHYQPKIDFSTRRISGVEALVRWQHPTRGLLSPDTFIPFAEETGLIRPLTEAIMRQAVAQAASWLKDGMPFQIAVNVSAINIQDDKFADQVEEILEQYNLPADLIELELTESAIMSEPKKAINCIKQLRNFGVQVSIDDFGTGYTSMSQLKELLVAKIKIDRSFVTDMMMNHNDAVIVRTTVDLGHSLGFKVVAEGVEDQATWDQLEDLGCDSAQGFHMARPLAPEAFTAWLRDSEWGNPKTEDQTDQAAS